MIKNGEFDLEGRDLSGRLKVHKDANCKHYWKKICGKTLEKVALTLGVQQAFDVKSLATI